MNVWAERAIDFVQALLTSWPTVVLVLGTIVLFRYKDELRDQLRRIKKVSVTGVELNEVQQTLPASENPSGVISSTPANPLGLAHFLSLSEKIVQPSLDESIRAEAHDRFPDVGDRERALIRNSTLLMAILDFERIRNSIWASQLAIVRKASQQPLAYADAKLTYEQLQADRPVIKDYDFKDYLGFLIASGLVQSDEVSIGITEKGKRFLIWYDGLPQPRPGNSNL